MTKKKQTTTQNPKTEPAPGPEEEPIAIVEPETTQKPLGIEANVIDPEEGGDFDVLDPYHKVKPEPEAIVNASCEPIEGLDLTDVKLAILDASIDLAGECQFRRVEKTAKGYKFEICFKSLKPMFGNQAGSRLVVRDLVIENADPVKIKRQLLVRTRGL